MKKIGWIWFLLLCVNTMLMAGGIEIPEKIKRSFQLNFPNASEVKWERANSGRFEVGFIENGKENLALINGDGVILEIESEINIPDLPKRVTSSVKKKYPYAQISYATVVSRNKEVVAYELEIKNGIDEFDITLNTLGFEVE
jgi:hypothetical protein